MTADQVAAGRSTSQSPVQQLYEWAAANGESVQPTMSECNQYHDDVFRCGSHDVLLRAALQPQACARSEMAAAR